MRNPNRIAGFLSQIVEFEGQILTSEIIYKVIHNVIKNKLYYTMYEYGKPEYKDIYFSEELEFSDEQVDDIISLVHFHERSGAVLKKKFLILIILIGICLLLAACQQNVRYHDASGLMLTYITGRG